MEEKGIIELLDTLSNKLNKDDCDAYSKLGLSPGEYKFMMAAYKSDTKSCYGVKKEMGISPSRFSRIVDKMVVDGLINRTPDKNDRRNNVLSFTKKGEVVMKEISECMKRRDKILTDGLSNEEKKTAKALLWRLIDNIS